MLMYTNVHGIYVDDMNLIIRADISDIDKCQELFSIFGKASALRCSWADTKATLLSYSPLSRQLDNLQWKSIPSVERNLRLECHSSLSNCQYQIPD